MVEDVDEVAGCWFVEDENHTREARDAGLRGEGVDEAAEAEACEGVVRVLGEGVLRRGGVDMVDGLEGRKAADGCYACAAWGCEEVGERLCKGWDGGEDGGPGGCEVVGGREVEVL